MTFDKVIATAKEIADGMAKDAATWLPSIVIEDREGELTVVACPNAILDNLDAVLGILKGREAHRAAFVRDIWLRKGSAAARRQDAVMLIAVDSDSAEIWLGHVSGSTLWWEEGDARNGNLAALQEALV